MYILNHEDDQYRMFRLPTFYDDGRNDQKTNHGISYLAARKIYQELGQTMGFDKPLSKLEKKIKEADTNGKL